MTNQETQTTEPTVRTALVQALGEIAAKDDHRTYLNGVLIIQGKRTRLYAATDGVKAMMAWHPTPDDEPEYRIGIPTAIARKVRQNSMGKTATLERLPAGETSVDWHLGGRPQSPEARDRRKAEEGCCRGQ